MQSNKFKGIIIYVLIIALLVMGLIAILNNIVPQYNTSNIVMFSGSYSELLDEYDAYKVKVNKLFRS